MISFTVLLEEADYNDYMLFFAEKKLFAKSKTEKIFGSLLYPFLLGLPIFIVVWYFKGLQTAVTHFALYNAVIFLLSLLGSKTKLTALYKQMLKRDAHKIVNDPKNKSGLGPAEFHFADEGIIIGYNLEKTQMDWHLITRMEETRRLILLDKEVDGPLMLPIRQIPDLDAFKALLAKKLSFHAEVGHKIEI